jgi:hypothetical protein
MSLTLLDKFNALYNFEVMGLPHGSPISMEELEAMAIEITVSLLADPDGLVRKDEALALAAQLREQGIAHVSENHPPNLEILKNNHDN